MMKRSEPCHHMQPIVLAAPEIRDRAAAASWAATRRELARRQPIQDGGAVTTVLWGQHLGWDPGDLRPIRRFVTPYQLSYAVVVAGLGRCGTTLLYRAILDSPGLQPREKWTDRMAHLQAGAVYKTHGFPPRQAIGPAKVCFVFGDPRNIVVSAHDKSRDWLARHYRHLDADLRNVRQFAEADTLRLREHFEAWYRPQAFELLTIRYETMCNYLREIESFLGVPLAPITFRPRRSNWRTHPKASSIGESQAALWETIRSAEDIKAWPVVRPPDIRGAVDRFLVYEGQA